MAQLMVGGVPNLYWNAVSTDRLRGEQRYTALPPVHDVECSGVESYRMVRQDSQLWSDLHQGMLTTGKLNSCLGFYEPMAAKRLGIGGGFVSHHKLCSAYHHLQQPVYVPPVQNLEPISSSVISPTKSGESGGRRKRSRYAASRGPQNVRMAWGSAQEGATLWALMHALPKSNLLEAGLFCVDQAKFPTAWGFKVGELPPMGASPDGMLFHPSGMCQVEDLREEGQAGAQEYGDILNMLKKLEVTQSPEPKEWADTPPLSLKGWVQTRSQGCLEIVEVKNRSPFRKSHMTGQYQISDTGPATFLPAMWIPQLQMEMLAADVPSALLVSRSATKGMTIFRVFKDNEYLRQMLVLIRRFNFTYVKARRPPPANMFFERSDYQAFLSKTLALARSATLLASVLSPIRDASSDSRPFLN